MNATSNSGGFLGSQNIGGFGYGIGVSVGVLLLITTITLASYYCTRAQSPPNPVPRRRRVTRAPPDPAQHIVLEIGIDEATLTSYPKLLYSEVKVKWMAIRLTF
ncbi:hypothetical protein RJ640_024976 [Escallonia rubra]|uniref:Uncharacterized protein n=1 Tax=Escallonia rubra TaxID=112253 RepID=A0AA88QLR2_9ASTE|nr:hypothetical protein RJ640_024976 [Escallonia rubra]